MPWPGDDHDELFFDELNNGSYQPQTIESNGGKMTVCPESCGHQNLSLSERVIVLIESTPVTRPKVLLLIVVDRPE